jgi:hypothetical protein
VLVSDVKIQTKDKFKHVLITQGTNIEELSSINLSDKDHLYFLPQYIPLFAPQDEFENKQKAAFTNFVQNSPQKMNHLEDIQQLMLLQPNLSSLIVLGDGLTTKQLSHLEGVDLSFTLSKAQLGPVNMNWRKQLLIGQPLSVQGIFQSSADNDQQIYQIFLDDGNTQSIETTRVKNNERFKFISIPKTTGLFVYQLKVLDDDGRLLVSEPIAFEVIDGVLPAIAIKQSSASFESRHFKNWAEQQGSKLLLLTQISKNKQIQQRINFVDEKSEINNENVKLPTDSITDSSSNKSTVTDMDSKYELLAYTWLQDFDLLYMDGRALLALSYSEQVELQKAVVNGLGLFIWADDSLLASFETSAPQLLTNFQLTPIKAGNSTNSNKQYQTSVGWDNGNNNFNKHPELIVPYKNVNITAAHAKILIYGENNKPLVINTSLGLGKIAVSLVSHSYQWSTSGQKSAYSQYWQYLLLSIARNRQKQKWQDEPNNTISYLGESFHLCTHSGNKNIVSDRVLLQQMFVNESTYCGIDWSSKLAWQRYSSYKNQETTPAINTVSNNVDSTSINKTSLAQQTRYIYPKNSWLTWQQAQKHQASRQINKTSKGEEVSMSYQPMDKKIIWLIFFISFSVLWIEQKSFK